MDSYKEKRDAFFSNKQLRLYDPRQSSALWNPAIRYGPMESTYQHDYRKPIPLGPPVKARPPKSTELWNRSVRYGPLETTYQHDYKTFVPLEYQRPIDVAPIPEFHEKSGRISWEAFDKLDQSIKDNQADVVQSISRTCEQRVSIDPADLSKKEAPTPTSTK